MKKREAFSYFKKQCRHWIKRFGMGDWEIEFEHKCIDGKQAECHAFYDHHATLTLDTEHDRPRSRRAIRRSAFHEIGELLLAELDILAKSRMGVQDEDLNMARHTIINRLAETFGLND